MNSKHIFKTLLFLFCSSILHGQIVATSESSSIILNKGKINTTLLVETPEIHIIKPEIVEEILYQSDTSILYLTGKIDSHEGIQTAIINNIVSQVDGDGVFQAQISLNPGVNEIDILVFDDNDKQIHKSFDIQYNTREMLFTQRVSRESDYYALIIGVNDYKDFPVLDRPVSDAEIFNDILISKYTFDPVHTFLLTNASKQQIVDHLDDLAIRVTANDNLLIFFAGHGLLNEDSKVGYWLPVDSQKNRISTYFSNQELLVFLKEIKAKHTLVIADACFGSSLMNITRSVTHDQEKGVQEYYDRASCKAMTSGSLRPVDDQSYFTQFLFEELSSSNEYAIPAVKLFSNFQQPVKRNSGVEPKFGEIKINIDRGGQFIFIKKDELIK